MEHPPAAAATNLAAIAAVATLSATVIVIAFGVIATSGTYGSRMAWLLGVAMPLLTTSMIMSWLARRAASAGPSLGRRVARPVFLAALSLLGIPPAYTATVLAVYAFLFAHHGLSCLS